MTLRVYDAATWKQAVNLHVYSSGWVPAQRVYVAVADTSLNPPGTIWELVETFVAPSAASETVTVSQIQFGIWNVEISVGNYTSDSHNSFTRHWEIWVNGVYHDTVSTVPAGAVTIQYSNGLGQFDTVKARVRYRSSSGNYGTYSPFSSEIQLN